VLLWWLGLSAMAGCLATGRSHFPPPNPIGGYACARCLGLLLYSYLLLAASA
jgi:hypothetical protein